MFHMFENEMLGVSIGSDYTTLASIFIPTLPWTSLESSFKPQVANQFVVKIASQKGTTQWDKVVCILLYIKGDRYIQNDRINIIATKSQSIKMTCEVVAR
jgi:hypothetical protein